MKYKRFGNHAPEWAHKVLGKVIPASWISPPERNIGPPKNHIIRGVTRSSVLLEAKWKGAHGLGVVDVRYVSGGTTANAAWYPLVGSVNKLKKLVPDPEPPGLKVMDILT